MLQEEALELSITELVSGSYSDHYVTLGNFIIIYLVPDLWIRIVFGFYWVSGSGSW